jgi:hypothetical protein
MTVRFLALNQGAAGRRAMVCLQWTVGLVLMLQALMLALSARAQAEFAGTGLPPVIRPLLAWPEVVSALLFLYPRTTTFGGFGLLAVLLATMGIHLYLAQGFVSFLVYMAAIIAVDAHHRESQALHP